MSTDPVTLHLQLGAPGPLSTSRRERWATAVEQAGADAPALVFLAELLGVVTGAEPACDCRVYTRYDMFGGCSRDFTITAGAAEVSRCYEAEISESWSSLNVSVDTTSIEGLPRPVFIDWNGESTGGLSLSVGGLDAIVAARVEGLARELFGEVEVRGEVTPRQARLHADLRRGQKADASSPEPVETLAEAFQSPDVDVARGALARLAELGIWNDPRIASAVQLGLRHPEWEVRAEVVETLWKTFDHRAVFPLVRALHDEREYVRGRAASGLSCLGDGWALPPLCVALGDPASDVRLRAVATISDLLKECPDPRVPPLLAPLLRDPDRYVASAAAWTLSEHPDPALAAELVLCLGHEYESVRHGGVLALGALRDPAHANRLLRCLEDDDNSVRMAAMRALADLAEKRALPLVERISRRKDIFDPERLLAQETMARLTSGTPPGPRLVLPPFEPPPATTGCRYLESRDGHPRRLEVELSTRRHREVPLPLLPAGATARDDGWYVLRHGDFYGILASPQGPAFFANGSWVVLEPSATRSELQTADRDQELRLWHHDEEVAAIRCSGRESGFMQELADSLRDVAFFERHTH
ncbi:MAG: HEAT repeat domain-containing protein [Thermoanaerobaculaceae bacterium]|jgi:HEAT repeat protein|nr:HEAT repeat domain-containing protein [Thermoanaerobaculaceae bacterium]